MKKRILVSAGDPSGDQLLARIIAQIKKHPEGKDYEFLGLAGPHCEQQGVKILVQSKDVAVVGLFEVLRKLPQIFKSLNRLGRELDGVDSLLCVDFPDFNLKLASMAKKKKVPVDYVVAPQVWAWRSGRVSLFRTLVRRLYPVLRFEEEYFRDQGVDAKFLGHPIRDVLPPRDRKGARQSFGFADDDYVMCLMPGSRHGELSRHLPLLADSWKLLVEELKERDSSKKIRGLWPIAKGWTLEDALATCGEKDAAKVKALIDSGEWKLSFQNHLSMMASDFAWIVSGTATLEAAYYQLPHILLYKLSPFSVMVLMQLSSYFRDPEAKAGLANILLERKVLPELLQHDLTPRRLVLETLEYLDGGLTIDNVRRSLKFLPKRMGEIGATTRIAEDLFYLWKQQESS